MREEPGACEPARRRRDVWTSLLLGLVCLLVYNANLRSISAGDAYPARYLPFGIWKYGSVRLDPISTITAQGDLKHYWMVKGRGGHAISLYPVVLPVIVAPLYLPAVAYLQVRGWTEQRLDRIARVMEKLTASLLAAASAALLYLLLRRRAGPRDALLLTLAFAFGTTTWVISSQALWQHGLAALLVIGALLLLTGPCTPRRALAAGFLCGLIACNRPPDAILAAALGIYGLWWARRRAPLLAAGAALPLGLVLAYNLEVAGMVAGAYAISGDASFFRHPLLPGIAGLLFSPTRGLLVFSPFLLALPLGCGALLRDRGARGLLLALGIAAVLQLLLYAKADWRTGFCWGPRWLTDLLPLLLWMLPPVVAALHGARRVAFVLAVVAAIAIEAVGAFWYTGMSTLALFAVAAGPDRMKAAWDPRNAPFVAELRHARPPGDLALDVRGNLDSVSAGGREVQAVTAGEEILLTGWALADDRAPWRVVALLDGQAAGATWTYVDRPDVRSAFHLTNRAGWRIEIPTGALAPGEHILAAAAQTSQNGEVHLLGQRRVLMSRAAPSPPRDGSRDALADAAPRAAAAGSGPSDDLAGAARRAAALLRERQQPAGYWLTSYTGSPRFEQPRREMNTFVTAMIVDLLAPVASAAGLEETLERARRHLAGQIEASGLVRYHGRPDAPTIPALGCAITPDADDTALVWRIAPGGARRELLDAALAVLDRYRTPDGLYRTWLAPRDRYQCIDPGKDPNPADVGIQMHVLLLLAQADPPAARALCAALGRAVADDRVWVYYQAAPLVPMLRQADLRQAGCSLRLPASRLDTRVPGQEIWVAAAGLLQRFLDPGAPAPAAAEARALLQTLASDDFAAIRRSPPLLYHNDFTASTPRFYWSEDFGDALWLRIVLENARRH